MTDRHPNACGACGTTEAPWHFISVPGIAHQVRVCINATLCRLRAIKNGNYCVYHRPEVTR